jgi:hypothetical protein
MPNLLAIRSAEILECLSVDTKVRRAGVSSMSLSYVVACLIDLTDICSFKDTKEGLIECNNASSEVGSRY